jgi:hypothetical protein
MVMMTWNVQLLQLVLMTTDIGLRRRKREKLTMGICQLIGQKTT